MSCFICLGSKHLIQPKCKCKTLFVHRACYTEWLKTAPDMFTCTVCKTDVSISFLSKCLTTEQLMNYDPNEIDEFIEGLAVPRMGWDKIWYEQYGIRFYEENGMLHFGSIKDQDQFSEIGKRTIVADKRFRLRKEKQIRQPKVRQVRF